ncbi:MULTISPECIES: urea carboxylase [Peribacillus]|uniref:Urea carboxylase n=2 Tax=root TaxID=1 RepID=A0AAN2TS40_9BACI|nr:MULTISPECIES: urea carboxylase [Peribacillus]MCP1152167.1 urea carboxylase [Peribacillus frigoritolerans]MCT1391700.1 urea carboxylase [Peribacillus frigoritolerans]MEA3576632.1 urea carboxylase [Peribacillus frigoritolerans]CEG31586.1 urea carboxylase [Peribacillus simplex]
MLKKVLIANRGAIATRIEKTLRRIGIQTVAVYTKADQDSLHVDLADEAVLIGEGAAKESYLNADLILKTAIDTGADAIHPGYGFLSENADFARACRKHGIKFIGPAPEQIEMFGLKHSAREMAEKANVPLLPGTSLINDVNIALKEAERIGYPIMLKSTAGGGGIGMRICLDKVSLRQAFDTVSRLAETNFNNGGVFLEKYIQKARHVEVQIFGNGFGEVAALGERDCSIQRRNQKVLEESPAPLLSPSVRENMLAAAKRLALEAGYRSAGTVEFLYDPETENFYFLEVNTRLQVEHGVTEEVLGIDLVEWMVLEATGELRGLDTLYSSPKGHSIQARIYAEDCLNDFRPSGGQIDQVRFPEGARIETWVRDGINITSFYDPMLAKIIVHAETREEAIDLLSIALEETRLYGVTTNLQYLHALLQEEDCNSGHVHTQMLEHFTPDERAIEVLDGGIQTTVQDWPGRIGHWNVGVPPCGPMDPFAFRIGNKLLGNDDQASGLELTLRGGSYRFRVDMSICLTGADMEAKLDEKEVSMYSVINVKRGQVLSFGEALQGMRTYLLVAGGLDMPLYLGSSSTFTLGGFGGHGGRALRTGDVLRVNSSSAPEQLELPFELRPPLTKEWTIGVILGPHCTEEYLMPDYLDQLTDTSWEVHFNSSRTGVRLIGPAPHWAREDGGEAGLHPSNIHDNAYAIGTLDLTGDMPILLGPDGPSLGGFVCPVTTASAEFWKIGQLHAGDRITFQLLTIEEANVLRQTQEQFLGAIGKNHVETMLPFLPEKTDSFLPGYPVLVQGTDRRFPLTIRADGDENILIEYGEMELDLLLRFQVHALMEAIQSRDDIPVIDLTPGIRSLQVHIDATKMSIVSLCEIIESIDSTLPPLEEMEVPSRIVRLPLSWDDPATQLAIDRYQKNVRPDAPWCPSNLEFIRRVNGLNEIDEVQKVVFDANYLVLGLGDVYLGAPVATPIDPRHRLVTTKYNPARTWTPENAVGIGGAYMCVYGIEGPGGYQFVGRTVQMWNRLRITKSFTEGKPWLLRFFDQIQFYPVGADELLDMRDGFLRGQFEVDIIETTFKLSDYLAFLSSITESADAFRETQQSAFHEERVRWRELGLDEFVSEQEVNETQEEVLPPGAEAIRCTMPGSVWKVLVSPGEEVKKGDTLIIEESMKMEFQQLAPSDGFIHSVHVVPGEEVHAGQLIVSMTNEKRGASNDEHTGNVVHS